MTGGGLPDGIPIVDPQDLAEALEKVSPSDLETHLDRRRPHGLCPPRLHALGDQAPRVEADGTGIRVTVEAPHLGGPITQELLAGHYVLVSAAPCRVIHQAHLDGGVAVLVLQGVSDDMGAGVASYDEGQAGG